MKLKILMPAVSVITAGSISYPYLFSTGSSGVSSSNSLSLNLNEPNFNNGRSLSDINSGKASALSVSPLSTSKNLSLEIQSNSPGINLDTKGAIMQANTLPVANLQKELDKEGKMGELTREQIQELREAIAQVRRMKQSFEMAKDKVHEYQSSKFDKTYSPHSRTFTQIGSQWLSRNHRRALLKFFQMYSKLDSIKTESLSKLNLLFIDIAHSEDLVDKKTIDPLQVIQDLERINWNRDSLKIFANFDDEKNLGWGEWSSNPYRSFYREEVWREKIKNIQDAREIYRLNKANGFDCSSTYEKNPDRALAIARWCDLDDARFEQLINGYESEIELDIASWLLDQMQIILKERETTR